MDDLEVRRGGAALRRRQGRHHLQPQEHEPGRDRAADATIHVHDSPLLGPEKDIPAPDVYTNPQTMAWIMDTFSILKGYTVPGVITGKPLDLGGSLGRNEATARGLRVRHPRGVQEAGHRPGQSHGRRAGLRQRRLHRRQAAARAWARRSSPSATARGGIYNPAGIDALKVDEVKAKHGSVTALKEAEADLQRGYPRTARGHPHSRGAWKTSSPRRTRPRSRPRSAARRPTAPPRPTPTSILHNNGVFVIPDILANAGGVTVSYFEWVQNLYTFYWTRKRSQQAPGAGHGAVVRRRSTTCTSTRRWTCAPPPTWWP